MNQVRGAAGDSAYLEDKVANLERLVSALRSDRDVGVLRYGQPGQPGAVPVGGIIAWYGVAAECPAGWAIVDGTVVVNGGTPPDLRDKVIIGAGTSYALGDTGGAATATLTHSGTAVSAHAGTAVSAHAGTAVSAHAGTAVSAHAGTAVANHAAHRHPTKFGIGTQSGSSFNSWDATSPNNETGDNSSTLTHSVTQPNNHTVTQPNDHTVMQPNNHTVTQPNNHTVTQPNDHTAFSILPPFAAFYWIVRTG